MVFTKYLTIYDNTKSTLDSSKVHFDTSNQNNYHHQSDQSHNVNVASRLLNEPIKHLDDRVIEASALCLSSPSTSSSNSASRRSSLRDNPNSNRSRTLFKLSAAPIVEDRSFYPSYNDYDRFSLTDQNYHRNPSYYDYSSMYNQEDAHHKCHRNYIIEHLAGTNSYSDQEEERENLERKHYSSGLKKKAQSNLNLAHHPVELPIKMETRRPPLPASPATCYKMIKNQHANHNNHRRDCKLYSENNQAKNGYDHAPCIKETCITDYSDHDRADGNRNRSPTATADSAAKAPSIQLDLEINTPKSDFKISRKCKSYEVRENNYLFCLCLFHLFHLGSYRNRFNYDRKVDDCCIT
jgi:hypothetical protein